MRVVDLYAGMPSERAGDRRRAVLQRFIEDRKLKVKPWAERAGVAPSTVYNFLNKRSDSLNQGTVERLAGAEGVAPGTLTGDDGGNNPEVGLPWLVGNVEAGVWREAIRLPREDWKRVPVPVPEKYERSAFCLVSAGPSMNQVYPESSMLVCVKLVDFEESLESGDRVVVHRVRGNLIEQTARELRIDGNRAWLWPKSDHPQHQAPVGIDWPPRPTQDGDATVEIHAVIVGDYRPGRWGLLAR